MTPSTGDYGADLILHKDQRIAVQAKCYTGNVGAAAVQEALRIVKGKVRSTIR